MKKQDRLNDIVLKMCTGEVCVKNLAKLYQTSERTIQNDIKELSQIYEITSPARGIYKINLPLEIEEKFEEVFSKFIMKANYDIFPDFENLIKKIELKTGFTSTHSFEINFKLEKLKNPKILIELFQAIEWEYTTEFKYESQKKLIQPLKILNYETIWYLVGFDLYKNKITTFKINNIENLISKTENLIGNDIKKFQQEAKNISNPIL